MVSPYGKELRKMRIDRSELLVTMAQKLDLSPAYLSAIENSTRSIPATLTEEIAKVYGLSEQELQALKKAEAESAKSIEIKLDNNFGVAGRQTALMFARSFNNISDADFERIKKILSGGNENDG